MVAKLSLFHFYIISATVGKYYILACAVYVHGSLRDNLTRRLKNRCHSSNFDVEYKIHTGLVILLLS